MTVSRRMLLALPAAFAADATFAQAKKAAPPKPAESDHGWYKLRSDDGKPFPNLRLPVEITSEIDRHPGMIRTGSDAPDVTLVEFYDYNCPWCRKAAADIETLAAGDAGLRIGLINNPILSAGSKEAALIELAVIKGHGRKSAFALHKALLTLSGPVDGKRAQGVATALGLDGEALALAATSDPELKAVLDRQMKLADNLALTVTPSFVIGGAGVVGYPGPKAMARMVAAVRQCELISCEK